MSEQKRKHFRLPIESMTFIELLSPPMGQAESGKLVTCKSLNISRGGLQVVLEEEITVGAFLQIGVDLPGAEDALYLVGEVRWCQPGEDEKDTWVVGFQLLNADKSDIVRWVEFIASMED